MIIGTPCKKYLDDKMYIDNQKTLIVICYHHCYHHYICEELFHNERGLRSQNPGYPSSPLYPGYSSG